MILDTPHAFLGAPGDDDASDPTIVAARLAEPDNAILAIDHPDEPGRLIAVAGIARMRRIKTRHRALIWGVYCDPDHRRRGHARAVTRAAIDIARAWRTVTIVTLSASADAPAAIALYESLGFERWGFEPDVVRIDGVSCDEVHMALTL